MLGDRRLPFALEFDQPCIKPQLRRAEANQFLEELEGLLLREAIKEPHERDLIGKPKPVMRESKGAPPPPPYTTGLYHFAILYPTRATPADALRRLIVAKVPLDGA